MDKLDQIWQRIWILEGRRANNIRTVNDNLKLLVKLKETRDARTKKENFSRGIFSSPHSSQIANHGPNLCQRLVLCPSSAETNVWMSKCLIYTIMFLLIFLLRLGEQSRQSTHTNLISFIYETFSHCQVDLQRFFDFLIVSIMFKPIEE